MKRYFFLVAFFLALAVPAAAGPLKVDQATPTTVTMMWDPSPESDLAGYRIYQSKISGGPYARIGQIQVMAVPEFTTGTLANGTYFWVVTAYNTAGMESGYSNEVSKTIATAPAPPKGLRLTILQALAWLWRVITFRG